MNPTERTDEVTNSSSFFHELKYFSTLPSESCSETMLLKTNSFSISFGRADGLLKANMTTARYIRAGIMPTTAATKNRLQFKDR